MTTQSPKGLPRDGEVWRIVVEPLSEKIMGRQLGYVFCTWGWGVYKWQYYSQSLRDRGRWYEYAGGGARSPESAEVKAKKALARILASAAKAEAKESRRLNGRNELSFGVHEIGSS